MVLDSPVEGAMHMTIETEREADGRWLAEVPQLPGVLAYGDTAHAAVARVQALALRVLAEQIDAGELAPLSFTIHPPLAA